jgi:hypothetical protein
MAWLEIAPLAQALRAAAVWALWSSWPMPGLDQTGALGLHLLTLIGLTVLAGLIVQIGFVILSTATGQERVDGIDDERDRLIEARSMSWGMNFAGLGFLAMAVALWWGWAMIPALQLLVGGFILADVAVNLRKQAGYWGWL